MESYFFSTFRFVWQGISLPVPPVLESLEIKMPAKVLKYPPMMDFLKVCKPTLTEK